jgi:hypothetical protein
MEMSDLAIFNGGVPAFLLNAQDETTNALAGGDLGARRLSIKGGVFREYIGGKEFRVSESRAMNVIVIKAAPTTSRTYYSGAYVEGEAVKPACWSSDSQRPDPKVKSPQADNCLHCPQNIKGSGQGDSRACRYSQRIAVAIDTELDREEVYQLVLPSTSVFGDGENGKLPLKAYAKHLKNNGVPITGVVTEMRFDTSSPTPKLVFRALRGVTESEYAIITRMASSKEAINAITMNVHETDNVTKEAPPPAAKPAPKAAKPVEKVSAEEVEEPKKQAPKKAVTADSELEDLVGKWDD